MTLLKGHFLLLSWKDSNPRKRNQNPMCYHYTTGQFLIATAKVLLFLLPPRKNPTFFQIFPFFLCLVSRHRYSKRIVAVGLMVDMMWLAPSRVR